MKRTITVQSDDEELTISTMDIPDNYLLKATSGGAMVLTDAQMRELKYLIDEILQFANKQDY